MPAKTARPADKDQAMPQAHGKQTAERQPDPANEPSAPSRDDAVRVAAYARAEARGFAPGHEVEDWLAAEAEIDAGAKGD